MALIAIATYDTPDNGRTPMTEQTLASLRQTVDFGRHRLVISDNGSHKPTHDLFNEHADIIEDVIYNGRNLGTANAINLAWRRRRAGETAIKMDNDVVIHQPGWVDWVEDAFQRDPTIGICGLKRKDLAESPWSEAPWYRSRIRMLPHEPGQRWIVVEEVAHVMGTCQGYSPLLLQKMGYLAQPTVYGFDDSLAAVRAHVLNFKCVFLHGFEIDHIDPGGTDYTQWKHACAGADMQEFNRLKEGYMSGRLTPYYDGGFDE